MAIQFQQANAAASIGPAPPASHDRAEQLALQLLEDTSWANDLDARMLGIMAKYMRVMYVDKDVRLFTEGDREHYLTIIADGKINIVKQDINGHSHVVVTLNRGKTFGELSLLDGGPRSSTAIAVEDCTLLILEEDAFNDLEDAHPALAARILRALARLLSQRLRMTSGRLVDHL